MRSSEDYDDYCRDVMRKAKGIMSTRGMSVQALADRIGSTRPHLSKALNGVVVPSFAYVARIADGLGLKVSGLTQGVEMGHRDIAEADTEIIIK